MMPDETSNIKTNKRLAALLGITLFIIAPLIIAIISIIIQINSHVSLEEALQSNASEDVAAAIIEQNDVEPEKTIIQEIKRDNAWVAAILFSISPNNFGDGALAVLHRQDNLYQTVYFGTGYSEESLTKLGVPNNLAKWLDNAENINRFSSVIYDSYLNPRYKYPIIKDLPFQTDRLAITYYFEDNLKDSDGTSIPIIRITATNAAERSNALDKVRRLGYDPGDYYINFANLKNPFIEEPVEEIIEINISEENQAP